MLFASLKYYHPLQNLAISISFDDYLSCFLDFRDFFSHCTVISVSVVELSSQTNLILFVNITGPNFNQFDIFVD